MTIGPLSSDKRARTDARWFDIGRVVPPAGSTVTLEAAKHRQTEIESREMTGVSMSVGVGLYCAALERDLST